MNIQNCRQNPTCTHHPPTHTPIINTDIPLHKIKICVQSCFFLILHQIRFYYHMFGVNIGTLNVYLRDTINGPVQNLWSKSGNVGDYYERTEVILYWDKPFQVIYFSKIVTLIPN